MRPGLALSLTHIHGFSLQFLIHCRYVQSVRGIIYDNSVRGFVNHKGSNYQNVHWVTLMEGLVIEFFWNWFGFSKFDLIASMSFWSLEIWEWHDYYLPKILKSLEIVQIYCAIKIALIKKNFNLNFKKNIQKTRHKTNLGKLEQPCMCDV